MISNQEWSVSCERGARSDVSTENCHPALQFQHISTHIFYFFFFLQLITLQFASLHSLPVRKLIWAKLAD